MSKIFLIVTAFFGFLLVIELGCFVWVLSGPATVSADIEVDAIVVFNGDVGRVKAGYEIAQSEHARFLVISPAQKDQLAVYDKRYHLPPAVSHIDEPHARTTLENAVFVRKIIDDHELTSILLVTSAYHMPRSKALMKLCLLGVKSDVRIFYAPIGPASDWAGYLQSSTGVKTLYNEMVRFWGSVGELIAFKIRGKLPERNPKDLPFVRFLKSAILFES